MKFSSSLVPALMVFFAGTNGLMVNAEQRPQMSILYKPRQSPL
jgi:hypothetical protein